MLWRDSLDFMTSPSRQLPARAIASTLLFIEGAVVLALGGWLLVLGFTHENREILPLLGVLLFAIAGGLGLIQCGRGYREGKNYGKPHDHGSGFRVKKEKIRELFDDYMDIT